MVTNDESCNLHGVVPIQIMKFFETDFEAFSCNLLV